MTISVAMACSFLLRAPALCNDHPAGHVDRRPALHRGLQISAEQIRRGDPDAQAQGITGRVRKVHCQGNGIPGKQTRGGGVKVQRCRRVLTQLKGTGSAAGFPAAAGSLLYSAQLRSAAASLLSEHVSPTGELRPDGQKLLSGLGSPPRTMDKTRVV